MITVMASRMCNNVLQRSRPRLRQNYKHLMNFSTSRTMAQESQENFDTVPELTAKLTKIMGVKIGYNPFPASRAHLVQYLPVSQEELPPRAMKDSFLVGIIPLSSDPVLQDKYVTFLGHVRVGRLLEDMDIFAVMVAQKHILNPKVPENTPAPHTLVTALVDRIDFSDFVPKSKEDIKISGHVSWVGKSSMEVVVWLEQKLHGVWHKITRALFLMAARDSTNTRAAFVNPIAPADQKEKDILAGGEDRKRRRMKLLKKQQFDVIPDESEQKLIHALYVRTAKAADDVSLKNINLPPGCVWMEQFTLSNTNFSHPEHRNLHNSVFGGFIMRVASEISWILAYKFSKYRPIIKSISDINFTKPIKVNSLFTLTAHVVYTQMQYVQVTVYVEADDPHTGVSGTTNTLHFTYEVPELTREVVPRTYHEAMMYIDGRRHFMENMKIIGGDSGTFLSEEGVTHKSRL